MCVGAQSSHRIASHSYLCLCAIRIRVLSACSAVFAVYIRAHRIPCTDHAIVGRERREDKHGLNTGYIMPSAEPQATPFSPAELISGVGVDPGTWDRPNIHILGFCPIASNQETTMIDFDEDCL
jgi:hypothetical protein